MATRTITITDKRAITSGVGTYGTWTLYELSAQTVNGQPVTDTLKTFQELPVGQAIEVEIDGPQDRGYGPEYTVKKPKGARYSLDPSPVDDAYEDLKQRVYAIEQHLGLVAAPSYSQPAQTDVPVSPVTVPPNGIASDDDIPF